MQRPIPGMLFLEYGVMPDFAQDAGKFIDAFLQSELKVSALESVRLRKVTKDDDYDR